MTLTVQHDNAVILALLLDHSLQQLRISLVNTNRRTGHNGACLQSQHWGTGRRITRGQCELHNEAISKQRWQKIIKVEMQVCFSLVWF